jgi:hypothetical protein
MDSSYLRSNLTCYRFASVGTPLAEMEMPTGNILNP